MKNSRIAFYHSKLWTSATSVNQSLEKPVFADLYCFYFFGYIIYLFGFRAILTMAEKEKDIHAQVNYSDALL